MAKIRQRGVQQVGFTDWLQGMRFPWLITWWLIPLSKWVITPVINGISRVNPLITGVRTHLLSGMSHQVVILGTASRIEHQISVPIAYFCSFRCEWHPKQTLYNWIICVPILSHIISLLIIPSSLLVTAIINIIPKNIPLTSPIPIHISKSHLQHPMFLQRPPGCPRGKRSASNGRRDTLRWSAWSRSPASPESNRYRPAWTCQKMETLETMVWKKPSCPAVLGKDHPLVLKKGI